MSRHPIRLPKPASRSPLAAPLAIPLAVALLLSACGGGSDDAPAVPALVDQKVVVVDGPIQGARVCLDMNDNDACDAGEPTQTTVADGSATLAGLAPADLAAHAVVAEVLADAVDADHGVVGTAYLMKTPAGKPALVSPLTTLAAAQMATAGGTADAADAALKEALGLTGSLFDNFAGKTDPAARLAATVARLVVVTTQAHNAATADVKDSAGNPLAPPDRARVLQNVLLTQLPALAEAAPALVATADDKRKDAVAAAAASLVADSGITAANLALVVAAAKLPPAPEDPASAPAAGTSLRWFSYTDAQNYQYRMFKSTAAQNVVVDGQRQFTEYRERSSGSNGAVTGFSQWGEGLNNQVRNLVYWTGTEWFACPTDFVHQGTPWDAKGVTNTVYCKTYKGTSTRLARDIAGRTMAEVVAEIRAWPLFDSEGDYKTWGPDPVKHADKLAARMPAGAVLYTYTGVEKTRSDLHGTHLTNDRVVVYKPSVAAGNSVIGEGECSQVGPANAASFLAETKTLEQMIAGATGKACRYTAGANVGETANDWGVGMLSVGDVADPAYTSSTGYHVSGTKRLRVSFAAGNVANYWLCLRRASDGSSRNCTAAGAGSYSIETQGDARVLRLAGQPAVANQVGYQRIFVERQGAVWYGSRSNLQTTHQMRLNQVASEALFAALGMPAPRAAEPLNAALLQSRYLNTAGPGTLNPAVLALMPNDNASLTGAWTADGPAASMGVHNTTLFFFANGDYVMADPDGDTAPNPCGGPGVERGSIAFDPASGDVRLLGNVVNTNGCAGFYEGQAFGGVVLNVRLAADGKTATVVAENETLTIRRLTK